MPRGKLSTAKSRSCEFANHYKRNDDGNFAVLWAFAAIPLMLAVSVAIDTANMTRVTLDLQKAADNAALAAVLPATMNDAERQDFAEKIFLDNVGTNTKFALKTESVASRERVDLTAKGNVPSLLGGITGKNNNDIAVSAAAELTRANVVCVLALDTGAPNAITFEDQARFSAPACSVQSNSTHADAILSASSYKPHAKSFCSAGGSDGKFDPFIKNECTPIADPYAGLVLPKVKLSCQNNKNFSVSGNNTASTMSEGDFATDADGNIIIPGFTTISPGTFCMGMNISGANVTFEPGVYYLRGDLHFSQFAQAKGDGVSFAFINKKNRLIIDSGALVTLRAPKAGPTKGLVFVQLPQGASSGLKAPILATSEISNGGGLQITGTAYLPDHELIISNDNRVASDAPATSFIARSIHFKGRSNTVVSVDHEKGGIPPLQPRSDEGARLVK